MELRAQRQEPVEAVKDSIGPSGEMAAKVPEPSAPAVGPGYTMIPLPAFTYNRNEGSWVGALTPIFRANEKGEVEDIFAPLYLHNELIGETFTFNYFGYRNRTTQFHAIASHATKIERTADVSYKNTAVGDGRYLLLFQGNTGKSAFNRFFGFGNASQEQAETTYTLGDSNIVLGGGLNIGNSTTLIFRERYRDVKIENGASQTLPQTLDRFPTVPGVEGTNVIGQGLALSYDTRDNQLTPLRGTWATALVEYDRNVKFDERNQWWRLTGEARQFYPHQDDRMVFLWHFMLDAVVGQDENSALHRGVPFYERPTLGGESTLRGFGRGRFVSDTAWLANIEERVTLVRRTIMGNMIEVEAAPFLDVGRVAHSFSAQGVVGRAQVNPGMGLRLLARPNIASRLDVGYGRDGAAVFVGLDYPF